MSAAASGQLDLRTRLRLKLAATMAVRGRARVVGAPGRARRRPRVLTRRPRGAQSFPALRRLTDIWNQARATRAAGHVWRLLRPLTGRPARCVARALASGT